MGSPPPVDFPAPSDDVNAGLDFPPSPTASVCGFALGLPRFILGLPVLPSLGFPPAIPLPFLSFALTCKFPNPVDVTAGLALPFGGGRTYNADPDPDLNDETP